MPVERREHEPVGIGTAVHVIVADPAGQRIPARAAFEQVARSANGELVVPGAALERTEPREPVATRATSVSLPPPPSRRFSAMRTAVGSGKSISKDKVASRLWCHLPRQHVRNVERPEPHRCPRQERAIEVSLPSLPSRMLSALTVWLGECVGHNLQRVIPVPP